MNEKSAHEKQAPIYSPTFKAQVALSALQTKRPLAELAWDFGVTHEELACWRAHLLRHASRIFECSETSDPTNRKRRLRDLKTLDDFQASC